MPGNSARRIIMAFLSAASVILAIAASVAFVHRDALLVRYYARRYVRGARVSPANTRWLVDQRWRVTPILTDFLRRQDARTCDRAAQLLQRMIAGHPDPTCPRDSLALLTIGDRLAQMFPHFSIPGRCAAVGLAFDILKNQLGQWSPTAPTAVATVGRLVLEALDDPALEVRLQVLERLPAVWGWDGADTIARSLVESWKRDCGRRAAGNLQSLSPRLRAVAARSLAGCTYHEDETQLITLIHDADAEVRSAALATLGANAIESLTPQQKRQIASRLTDEAPVVRQQAQALLLSAGVNPIELDLLRRLRARDPAIRAEVADRLARLPNVDPVPSLLELLRDESSLVRLAALRAGLYQHHPDWKARLAQIVREDPSEEVRGAAREVLIQIAKKP